jgi:hypothetical protein
MSWPTNYSPGDHTPSIFVADTNSHRSEQASARTGMAGRQVGKRAKIDAAVLRDMRLRGETWQTIADHAGLTITTVITRVMKLDPKLPRKIRKDIDDAKIAQARDGGMSWPEIAKLFGCGETTAKTRYRQWQKGGCYFTQAGERDRLALEKRQA